MPQGVFVLLFSRLGLVAAVLSLSASAFAQSRFTIERLGAVPNTNPAPQSRGLDVSDSGVVVGYTNRPGPGQTATVFPAGAAEPPLYLAPGATPGSSSLFRINESGLAVGYGSQGAGDRSAYRNSGDPATPGLTLLPPLVAAGSTTQAADVNESGLIVGNSRNATNQLRAVYWSSTGASAPTDLAGFAASVGTVGSANGVNDAGVIVGNYANAAGVRRIARWTPTGGVYGGAEGLSTLAATNILSDLVANQFGGANAVNTRGDIVGTYTINPGGTGNRQVGFFYNAITGNFATMGRVAANDATTYFGSVLRDVNDSGVAVGNFGDGTTNGERAAIWENGIAFNLNGMDAGGTRVSKSCRQPGDASRDRQIPLLPNVQL